MTTSSLIGLVGLLVSCSALDFTGFEPLLESPQDFTVIEFGIPCPENLQFVGKVTKIQWTVEPVKTDTVTILSSPPLLVDASAQNGVLRFNYNAVSLSRHEAGAGVLIQVPQDQLKGIVGALGLAFTTQVLTGFSGLNSILQQGVGASLVVFVNNTVGSVQVFDSGRANRLYLGTDVDVQAEVSGNSNSVTIDGTLKSGTLSGSNCVVWADEFIEQLTVTGTENRIFTADGGALGGGCKNVDLQADRNICDLTTTKIPVPPVPVTSTEEVILTCTVPNVTDTGTSSGATSRPFLKSTLYSLAIGLWHALT